MRGRSYVQNNQKNVKPAIENFCVNFLFAFTIFFYQCTSSVSSRRELDFLRLFFFQRSQKSRLFCVKIYFSKSSISLILKQSAKPSRGPQLFPAVKGRR